jgi:hypothetical protein
MTGDKEDLEIPDAARPTMTGNDDVAGSSVPARSTPSVRRNYGKSFAFA